MSDRVDTDLTDAASIPNRDLPAALDELLTEAVREATGLPDAMPRPGQQKLAHDILRAMINATSVGGGVVDDPSVGQVLGQAGTGVGKSLAYLAPAMLMSLARGHRSVVSTESLSLQAQILDKDAPTVASAAARLYGRAPVARVLKGWSNFACAAQTAATAAEVLGRDSKKKLGPEDLTELADGIDVLAAKQARSKRVGVPKVTVDGEKVDGPVMLPLLSWSLRSHLHEDTVDGTPRPVTPEAADRHSYPGSSDSRTWEAVSVTPDACPGAKDCPFGDICAPTAARAQAGDADLVVTNHSMLAVQAARGVPVVLGNRRLGTFDHLVVDEAHTVAGNVRSQGARSISAWRVHGVGKALEKLVVGGRPFDALLASGQKVADRLDLELTALLPQSSRSRSFGGSDTVVESLPHTVDPLLQTGESLGNWLREARKFVPKPEALHSLKDQVRARQVSSVITEFLDDIGTAREAKVGQARWVESGSGTGMFNGTSVKLSPVDVSGRMRDHLYTADVLPFAGELDDPLLDEDALDVSWSLPEWRWCEDPDDAIRKPPRHRLSVSHVSATLATSHRFDNGLDVAAKDYESPFAAAYGSSALYVPRAVTPEDLEDLTSRRYGKASFDTSKHADWAASHVVQLVAANDGSALVLASTVRAGQLYAQHLRSAPATKHLPVFSQWDGPPVRHLLADWKADHQAVMVGTKSLMTGVDAPGQTCTLVVVDRNPRAAGNPVDDARVEAVMERAGLDKWSADRHVYVADSALLLTQAAGRLIRGVTDSGMVAVLDPRLLKSGPLSMKNRTAREDLMAPLGKFATKIADLHLATEWLAEHRAAGRVEDGTVEEGAA